MIIKRAAIVHQDKRRVAHQCRHPARKIGVSRADMRVERFHGQHVPNGGELHIDKEHTRNQRIGEPDGVRSHFNKVHIDDIAKAPRDDGYHERKEKSLDRPCPQVMENLLSVPIIAARNPRAEVPDTIAGIDQAAIQPDDIGHRQ